MPLIGKAFVAEFRRAGTAPRSVGGMDAIRAKLPGTPVSAIFTKTELEALRAQEPGHA